MEIYATKMGTSRKLSEIKKKKILMKDISVLQYVKIIILSFEKLSIFAELNLLIAFL